MFENRNLAKIENQKMTSEYNSAICEYCNHPKIWHKAKTPSKSCHQNGCDCKIRYN